MELNDEKSKLIINYKYENLAKSTLKASQEKSLRKKILDDIPKIGDLLDLIWPKKVGILIGKMKQHVIVYFVKDRPVFIQVEKYPITPHMSLLLEYPFLLDKCQVDKGAVKFLLSGSDIMCPGLTSKGGILPEVKKNTTVAVFAEEKNSPLCIGYLIMNKEDIIKHNSGIAIEMITFLGDDIWFTK